MGTGPRALFPRILLIDDLDALGADVADAEQKAAWLEAAGARVTWMAVTPAGAPDICVEGSSRGSVVPWERRAEAIRARLAEARWHRVVLASAAPGGGALARLLPRDAVWWPAGIAPAAGGASLTEVVRRLLRADPSLAPLGSPEPADAPAVLAWAATESRAGRRVGLPLWDGDLLLLPEGLGGPSARPILAAFAHLAERWSGIDLVTWTHPTVEGDGHARAHGVDTRLPRGRPAAALGGVVVVVAGRGGGADRDLRAPRAVCCCAPSRQDARSCGWRPQDPRRSWRAGCPTAVSPSA